MCNNDNAMLVNKRGQTLICRLVLVLILFVQHDAALISRNRCTMYVVMPQPEIGLDPLIGSSPRNHRIAYHHWQVQAKQSLTIVGFALGEVVAAPAVHS